MNFTTILGDVWMPTSASTVADDTDAVFYFIHYLSAIFLVAIVAATIYFALKYKKRSDNDKTSPIEHNSKLEFWWSFLPGLLLVVMFIWGFDIWLKLQVPPANAMNVRVTARQWTWQFDYPKDGITAGELVVPVNTPVKLTMSASDVLHSFYVPEFRVKKDVLPNRYSVAWFEATEPGEYNVFCTEYCGKNHSRMITRVQVKSAADFEAWRETGGVPPGTSPAEAGKIFYKSFGCNQCHSSDGTANTGPTFLGLYGSSHGLTDGTTVVVDDNYIRESIEIPGAKVVAGFQPRMPSFKGKIKDKQMVAIIEFLKTLSK